MEVMARRAFVPVTAKVLGTAHRVLYRLSGGRIGATIWSLPVVLLTTTGRKTGKARTTALCTLRVDDDFVVIASFGGMERHPDWWLNLEHTPRATLQIGRQHVIVDARTATGEERARLWAKVVTRAPGYLNYARRTAREIPVVVLERLEVEAQASRSSPGRIR
jgi:deazaflavin-dependent oxidoreductase (nitroreductase family)